MPKMNSAELEPSEETNSQKLAIAAYITGYAAFKDDKPCIPACDRNLDALLEGLPFGTESGLLILSQWIKGWGDANLAAHVENS